nr:hypothetical protein [Stenotrophomonas sp. 57]
MSTTSTILLVHGFRGGAARWAKVILQLHGSGRDRVQAVELPHDLQLYSTCTWGEPRTARLSLNYRF